MRTHKPPLSYVVLVGQVLEILRALVRALQVVQVRRFEVLLEVLDVVVKEALQHVDVFQILIANHLSGLFILLRDGTQSSTHERL